MNQLQRRVLAGALAGLVAVSLHAEVLTCQSSAEDVRRVYDDGSNQKVGDMKGNQSKFWKRSRMPSWDEPIFGDAWYVTGDYSASRSGSIDSLTANQLYQLAVSLDRIEGVRKMIAERCLQKNVDPCQAQNSGPAECLAFYSQRYSGIFERMEERQREIQASPRLGHVEIVRQLAAQGLGIPQSRQVVVGEYVSLEWSSKPSELASFPLEQANLRALDRVSAASRGAPEMTKGEFETTAAFEDRKKKAITKKASPVTMATALETEINSYNRPYIDSQSIKYDADKGVFDVVVRFSNTSFSAPMTISVKPEDAPAVKAFMMHPSSRYDDPEKVAQPWLVFALSDSSMVLKGGYLMRRVGKDKGTLPMQVKTPAIALEIGNDGAKKFLPKLQSERAAKLGREQLQKQAQQEQFCRNLKLSVAANNPAYYGTVVRGAGCN